MHVVQRVRYMQRHTYVIVAFSLIHQHATLIELVFAKKFTMSAFIGH